MRIKIPDTSARKKEDWENDEKNGRKQNAKKR